MSEAPAQLDYDMYEEGRPIDPGFADRLHARLDIHVRGDDGLCRECREWPCWARATAIGLLTLAGLDVPEVYPPTPVQ